MEPQHSSLKAEFLRIGAAGQCAVYAAEFVGGSKGLQSRACVCLYMCMHMYVGACRGQKRALDLLDPELKVFASCLWVLASEARWSAGLSC